MTRAHAILPVHVPAPLRIAFLQKLADTGSEAAAVTAAAAVSREFGFEKMTMRAWIKHRHTDLQSRIDWYPAEAEAAARVEQEIMTRAMEGVEKQVYYKGSVCGTEKQYDNQLLLRVAKKLNPEAWAERAEVKHQHKHDHEVKVSGVVLVQGPIEHHDDWKARFNATDDPPVIDAEFVDTDHQLTDGSDEDDDPMH
jgi:hypothetical protein